MKNMGILGLIAMIIVLFIAVISSLYTLNEYEQAIVTQFGKPIGGAVTDPGLHFKIPFIQVLHRFEKRILIWDGSANQIPTADKKYIWLDTTARWKILNPLVFYQSVGNERGAQTRLDDIVDSAARDVVSSHALLEIVRNSNRITEVDSSAMETDAGGRAEYEMVSIGRERLTHDILIRASELVSQYGIELLDVQAKRINYIEDVRKKVYERMISERQRIASKYRSEGEGKKAEILGMKERELNKIQSEAYKEAQKIRGEADARATKIFADAYRKDPEFYSFLKTMEVYKTTIGENTRAILTTDSDIYKYIKNIDIK